MSVPLLAEKSFNRLSDKISSVTQFNVDASDEKVIGHDSGLVRLFLFYDSIRIIGDNWITGVGVNNGQFYLRLPASFERLMSSINSQNNFSETLLNGGIIAFLLYYAPLIYILSRSIGRSHKNDFEYAIISLIGLKIFLDLGMKSYNDASHIMIVALVFYYHFMSTRLRYEN
jgi:O-antigen ligase